MVRRKKECLITKILNSNIMFFIDTFSEEVSLAGKGIDLALTAHIGFVIERLRETIDYKLNMLLSQVRHKFMIHDLLYYLLMLFYIQRIERRHFK